MPTMRKPSGSAILTVAPKTSPPPLAHFLWVRLLLSKLHTTTHHAGVELLLLGLLMLNMHFSESSKK